MMACVWIPLACWAEALPLTSAKTLSDKRVVLPDAVRGHVAVIVIGFRHASRNRSAEWGKRLEQQFAGSDVTCYEAAMLQDVPRLMRGMVVSSIRKGVPAAQHDRFLVLLEKEDEWKKLAKFSEGDAAYVLLVARDGNVVWTTHAKMDEPQVAELQKQIALLRK
jgi:hypothetical protein